MNKNRLISLKQRLFKKKWAWVALAVLLIIVGASTSGTHKNKATIVKASNTKYTGKLLQEVDVNGLTIKDACDKVREKGWKVREVAGSNDYTEKSDCSDLARKVSAYYYTNLDSSYDRGTVGLEFANAAKKADSSATTPATTSTKSTNVSTSTPSTPPSSTDTSSATGYQAIYDQYAAKLRSECPNLSITDCATISNEGITKMAEYMYKAHGTDGQYQTYSDWAGKLTDVYMAVVQ